MHDGNRMYKQISGIPIRGSSILADIYLHVYEKTRKRHKKRKLSWRQYEIEKNAKLLTKVYDKRDDFVFKTIRFLHFYLNIHISVFRNVFMNVLNRIEKISLRVNDLVTEVFMWDNQVLMQCYIVCFI